MLRVVGCSVFGCRVPCFTFELIGLFPRADNVKAEAHCNPTAISRTLHSEYWQRYKCSAGKHAV